MKKLLNFKKSDVNNDDLKQKVEDMQKEIFARRVTERLSEVRKGIAHCIKQPADYYLPLALLWREWVAFRTHDAGFLTNDRQEYCDGLKPIPEITRKCGDKGRIVEYYIHFEPPTSGVVDDAMAQDRQWIADAIFKPFTYGPTDMGWEWPELQFVGWLRGSEFVHRVAVPMQLPKLPKRPKKKGRRKAKRT